MRTFTHPAFAFVSAALAACCLLAGHARRAAVHITRAARPAAQTSALLQGAGRALDVLRRRMQQAARRALAASLLLLAAPGSGLAPCAGQEFWTDVTLLPAGVCRTGGRTLRLPRPGRDTRTEATPPPGGAPASQSRDAPARCVLIMPPWAGVRTMPLRI